MLTKTYLPNYLPTYVTVVDCSNSDSSNQRCRRLPNFGRSPEFGRFQKIAQKIAQNFCAIFKIGQKHPKKLPNATETLKKLPKIAQNFYIFVKSTQQKLPKNSRIFLKCHKTFPFLSKVPKKAPEKLPNSGEISIW